MPTPDLCIASIFEPGNIPATPGTPPVKPPLPSLIDPDDYEPDDLTYSLDFAKFYNSPYLAAVVMRYGR